VHNNANDNHAPKYHNDNIIFYDDKMTMPFASLYLQQIFLIESLGILALLCMTTRKSGFGAFIDFKP